MEEAIHEFLQGCSHDWLCPGLVEDLLYPTDHPITYTRYVDDYSPLLADRIPTALYYLAASQTQLGHHEQITVSPPPTTLAAAAASTSTPTTLTPLPLSRPLWREACRRLTAWAELGRFPATFLPMRLLSETPPPPGELDRVASLEHRLTAEVRQFACAPTKEAAERLLTMLGVDGLRALMGVRVTKGTALTRPLPPSMAELLAAFCFPFNDPSSSSTHSKLTVGGRALTKHCQRSKDGWWGDGHKGSDEQKNQLALSVLVDKILTRVAWINVHALPHEVVIVEVRNAEGYGARWLADPPFEFRGFLEPQMEDGHDIGWIH